MTINETKTMIEIKENDDYDWVTAYGDCTIYMLFDSLRTLVERDVTTANNQKVNVRKGNCFKFDDNNSSTRHFQVERFDSKNNDRGEISFSLHDDYISIIKNNKNLFSVVPKWNILESKCEVKVDDDIYKLWQVSAKALCDFFFKDD